MIRAVWAWAGLWGHGRFDDCACIIKLTMTQDMIERLMEIEAGVRYSQPPGPGESPFVVVRRNSAVILSAPHGAVTYRGK